MPDDLLEEAVARKHCTVSEALGVFAECGCRWCVLTHVSQRFAKAFPVVEGGSGGGGGKEVVYAADLMSFEVGELAGLAGVSDELPTAAVLFDDDDDDVAH
jgi:ribonuclease Z